jgi:hypothetical protein
MSSFERDKAELQTCINTIDGCREEIERQNIRIQELVTKMEAQHP